MESGQAIQFAVVIGVASGVLYLLHRRGALAAGAFAQAPPRAGSLTINDLLIGVTLWLLGGMFGVALMRLRLGAGMHDAATTAEQQLALMGGMVVGQLPAIAWIIDRANRAVIGGVSGFGLGIGSLLRAPGEAVRGLLTILPLVFAASVAVTVGLMLLDRKTPQIAHELLESMSREPWGPVRIGLIAFAVFAAPLTEELVFRGLIQTTLRQAGVVTNPWWAILATTVPWVAIHVTNVPATWASLPAIYVLGIGLGWVYERTGNLWAPILMHAAFNAFNIALTVAGLVEP